jgi:hypothetical protein
MIKTLLFGPLISRAIFSEPCADVVFSAKLYNDEYIFCGEEVKAAM